ncbi:unnamed protein product [Medioppia subpectinata]|uniref:UV radiation resistance-associated gene protein n=1 Tax=Medioppia subpectinata TaxID=1979941 RepID=A0A7R9PWA6_9ACAR|nr:unnamed protein product [Medioppia subpectinata]CAG2103718.1 unnamed protein product [Medioppia subpectinata]
MGMIRCHLRHIQRIGARNIRLGSEESIESNGKHKSSDELFGFWFAFYNTNEELLYESETIFNTSPDWKGLESCSLRHSTISELTIRLYSCHTMNNTSIRDDMSVQCMSSELLIEWRVHLNGLVFIGEQIPKDKRFKSNTIILGLMEGFYTSVDSIASDELLNQLCLRRQTITVSDATVLRHSYCLNVLYRIEMMQRVITQTLDLMTNRRNKLEQLLAQMLDKSELKSKVELMEVKVKNLEKELVLSKHKLNTCRVTKAKNESEICEKGIDMLNKIQDLKQQKEKMFVKKEKLDQTKDKAIKCRTQLTNRRHQLMHDICNIYPLVPFPDGNGGFSICGVHLPDSEHFDGHDDTMISIAIGYVTHILVMISRLLDVTLRYNMIYFGSRSSIVDHLNDKISENDRIFALHSKSGKDRLHFKYGVFLMNKNIAQLRHYLGLQTKDLSATLPNLYTLFNERLVSLNIDSTFESPVNRCDVPNSGPNGHSDDYLRRELEVMLNHNHLLEAGPSKANAIRLRNLSNVSNKAIAIKSESRSISRSLDKGLNEMVANTSSKTTTDSYPTMRIKCLAVRDVMNK